MTDKLLDRFRRQEAETAALSAQFNRWSLVMIELLIREQEQKLVAGDQPVERDVQDPFWVELQ